MVKKRGDLRLVSEKSSAAKTPEFVGLGYYSGFGNHIETEAEPGALPRGQNSPQKCPLGLYAEQLSGSAFSANRHENLRSWLYRIRPSVLHKQFTPLKTSALWRGRPFDEAETGPEQMRWDPVPLPGRGQQIDFVNGVFTICGNGDKSSWRGCAVHIYAINASMENRYFYNADGEMLFVPEIGTILL
ncbi:MAG TPA: homogentisate 1,2-dioxygenase, partial [Chroococcales cyanobacterium]